MILRAIIIYLIGINILTFLVFGIDKWKARSGKWRIPEATLIGMSIAAERTGNPFLEPFNEPEEDLDEDLEPVVIRGASELGPN